MAGSLYRTIERPMPHSNTEVKQVEEADDATAMLPPIDAAHSLRTARGVLFGLIIGLLVWGVLVLSWWRWA
jgi:hypothetical protein